MILGSSRALPGAPQVLDLSHNAVHHQEDLAALSQLPALQQVVLLGNPLAQTVRHKQAALTKTQVGFRSTAAGASHNLIHSYSNLAEQLTGAVVCSTPCKAAGWMHLPALGRSSCSTAQCRLLKAEQDVNPAQPLLLQVAQLQHAYHSNLHQWVMLCCSRLPRCSTRHLKHPGG